MTMQRRTGSRQGRKAPQGLARPRFTPSSGPPLRGGRMLGRLLLGLLLLGSLPPGAGAQGTGAGVSVTVSLAPSSATLTPPQVVEATITVTNTSGGPLLLPAGFSSTPWELLLFLRDQNGRLITANASAFPYAEGPPPPTTLVTGADGKLRKVQVQPLEVVAAGFTTTTVLADLQSAYTISRPGTYTVEARIPVRRFAGVFEVIDTVPVAQFNTAIFEGVVVSTPVTLTLVDDQDGDGYTFPTGSPVPDCDDTNAAIYPGATEVLNNGLDDDCNPGTPDVIPVTPAVVQVEAELHTVGSGSHPGANKVPLANLPVKVFDRTSPCVQSFGVTPHDFPSIWLSNCPGPGVGTTDAQGETNFTVPPGQYLVIGEYQPGGGAEPLYPGKNVGDLAEGDSHTAKLKVIVKANGKSVPGKATKKNGSVLWIIEPAYVEWDSTEELYPFIFESEGDWTVTTTVAPPEGFVADHPSLTEEVNTELKAVQFTITDVGSEWVDTDVTHELTHTDHQGKVKKEKVKTKVGVKLSKALAKAKGLTRWGKVKKAKKEEK